MSFKPYYKWNTFNTLKVFLIHILEQVLNLIINGIPSIQKGDKYEKMFYLVLNLIINGIPSILEDKEISLSVEEIGFKPYYKWNTFNTSIKNIILLEDVEF